ncbi:MAG: hypothetical protein IPK26_28605 [Planctomycetes bacterium]|nr:hypothetical protein [Planctomycetota bacterium]
MRPLVAPRSLDASAEPVPTWFWMLPLVALVAWWPLEPYWQSDDFVALHYAKDFGQAAKDLIGPQYGATDIWLFWRPLITLSFWFDATVAGGNPWWSHFSNVLAHGISTLLLGLLWLRLLRPGGAFAAAALWAMMPGHAGSLCWAVGRVDSHTTVWILLTLWTFVRGCERQSARQWPTLLWFAAALASKELAVTVPAICTLLGAALDPGHGPTAWRRGGFRSWPLWALLGGYLLFRLTVLGRFGGYLAAAYDPIAMVAGLADSALDLVNPARWTSGELARAALGHVPVWLTWLGYLPLLLVPWFFWTRDRLPEMGLVLALFLIACAPLAAFLAGTDNHHNLRYFYLPSAALTGLFAAGGRWLVPIVLLLWLPSLIDVRSHQLQTDRTTARMHRALQREVDERAPAPLFVAGLPHAHGQTVQLHFGIDRLLRPPFHAADVGVYALRPIVEVPGVLRLTTGDEAPFLLPLGSTWFFVGSDGLARAPSSPLPDLPVEPAELDLGSANLMAMAERRRVIGLRTPGVRTPFFRLTIFTATGYLCSVFANHAAEGQSAGEMDLLRWFGGDPSRGEDAARYALTGDAYVLRGLEVPTTLDLSTRFPVLLEGGTVDLQAVPPTFTPSHRTRKMLQWQFDREFPKFVRRVLGLE